MRYSITIIAVSLLISIIMAAFLVWPKYQEFSNLKNQLEQKRTKLENQNRYVQQLEAADAKLQEKEELVSKVNSALPIGPDIPSLLEFLQEASLQTGVSLEKIDWQEARLDEKERIKDYSLGLSFSGSYFAFKNFLYALERSARLIDVFQISFTTSPESEEPIPFKIMLKVHSY